jgi:uncharacterized phage protein (TIGR02220 family)
MAEGRMLKRCISESKKLGKLKSDSARLLYTWLIPWLDVEGRHSADPEIIKGHIFPKVKNTTPKKISNLLNLLNDEKLIILYSANGEDYLQFIKFHELQTIRKDREGDSKIPAPSKDSSITPGVLRRNPAQVKLNKDKLIEVKEKVIDHFNEITNQKRSYTCDGTNKLIMGRLSEGRTIDDFKHVIDTKYTQWRNDEKMSRFIRPSTLFRPGNFEDYLNEPYEDPRKKVLKVGESYTKEPEFLPMELLNQIYRIIDSKGGDKGKFYTKAKSAFPIIRTQWDNSDKKPETFIKLVEEVK